MEFPTIKKPKSKPFEGANLPSTMGKGIDGTETLKPKGFKGIDTIKEDGSIEKSAADLADKSLSAIGSDKSDKAEAIRARALLLKGKAPKQPVDEESMAGESTERYEEPDSYTKEKGFYKSRKK